MRWIDGKEINIKQFTGETLCEKLAADLWDNDYDQWWNVLTLFRQLLS